MNVSSSLAHLFARDLARLVQEIEAFPDEVSLWPVPTGIINPAGNLILHIEGNLASTSGDS